MNAQWTPEETSVLVWVRLVKAHTRLMGLIQRRLKDDGLPPLEWYDVLLELKRAPASGLRPGHLQQELLLAQHNLSRLLDRLEQAGLVERVECVEDGRGQVVVLTNEGRAMQRRMWPVYRAAIDENVGAHFSLEQLSQMSKWLNRLAQAESK
jgi:DNA-binding MarR family transcriptional regulator